MIGSGLLDLRELSPGSDTVLQHCTEWGRMRKTVSLKTPTGHIVASVGVTIQLTNGGTLLRAVSTPVRHPSFVVGARCVGWSPGVDWRGSPPRCVVKIKDLPPLVCDVPHGEDDTTTMTAAFTAPMLHANRIIGEPGSAVHVIQEQGDSATRNPLTKGHVLLRGSGELELRGLEGEGVGEWGKVAKMVSVFNPKGECVGRVTVEIRLFCGGGWLTAGEVDSAPVEAQADARDWSMKFGGEEAPPTPIQSGYMPKMSIKRNGGLPVRSKSPTQNPAATSLTFRDERNRSPKSPMMGATMKRAMSPKQGRAVMKSMHFEGKEGPFSMYIEPMQGMPAPTSLDGETRLDSVQIDDAPASAFGTSAFGSSSESEMKPRCAVSITLEGDLEAIAARTAVRRLYEKKFTKDVSDALACNPEHIDILACRKGSIVVDFHITCDECENYVEELKRQVMDPSSRLMNGEVTKKTIKVLGEVEYVRERSERTLK